MAERTRALIVVAGGVVLVAAVAFRFVAGSHLWLDEALSVNIASLPLGDVPDALRRDGAPPLYYLLLGGWTRAFGTSDVAVRSLSGVLSVATLVVAWWAGRRIGGRTTAWLTVAVVAVNPYAVRYATEARMYSLQILLVFAGILAARRAWERPEWDRLALLAAVAALLAYTQYWSLFLVGVAAAGLVGLAWSGRGTDRSRAARMLVALALGGLAFVPWLPTFVDQLRTTGTPWGVSQFPTGPLGVTLLDFGGGPTYEGWVLVYLLAGLATLGALGRAVDGRRIEVDLVGRPEIRPEIVVGVATIVLGTTVAWLGGSAFQTRYSAVVFPFFALAVAHGLAAFADRRVRIAVLAVVVACGFAGLVRNATTERTQAGAVAAVLGDEADPDDVVVLCPDQLGPAVDRLVPADLDLVTYPDLGPPELVDWVDYEAVLDRADPVAVASEVRERAGTATIWLVAAEGYRTHVETCATLRQALVGVDRERRVRVEQEPARYFESMALDELVVR